MKEPKRPYKNWRHACELTYKSGLLDKQINRLMLLDYAWKQVVGDKVKFWKIAAIEKKTLQVCVKLSVARNELIARREMIIKEINKYFDKPWIEKIEIVKDLGDSHE